MRLAPRPVPFLLAFLVLVIAVPLSAARRPQATQSHADRLCALGMPEDALGGIPNPPIPSALDEIPTANMEEYGCYCTYWQTVCAPYMRCYNTVECRIEMTCTPDGCTENQVCETVLQCELDWYCWSECARWICYI
jgi:hypothetical protein